MTNSNNLNIPFVVQSQAQKEVTINEAISILDAMQNCGVVDKDLATPPGSPATGSVYIIAASPTGAWSGKAGQVAYYNSGWKFIVPKEGMKFWVNDEDSIYCYDGTNWVAYSSGSGGSTMLGVNATPDSTNRLSVNSDAVLLNNNGTDIRTKLNKNAVGNTASFLFQNGFSGRAEFGLVGDDDFTLKTSPDGSAWNNSFKALKTDGSVDFLNGIKFNGGSSKLANYEEGTFTPTLVASTTPGTASYNTQTGVYTRVGNRVFFEATLIVTSLTGSAGSLRIDGLPYAAAGTTAANVGYYANANLGSAYGILVRTIAGNTYMAMAKSTASGASSMTAADISASFDIRVSGHYKV